MDGTENGIFCPNLCHNNLQPKLDAIVSSIRIRTAGLIGDPRDGSPKPHRSSPMSTLREPEHASLKTTDWPPSRDFSNGPRGNGAEPHRDREAQRSSCLRQPSGATGSDRESPSPSPRNGHDLSQIVPLPPLFSFTLLKRLGPNRSLRWGRGSSRTKMWRSWERFS